MNRSRGRDQAAVIAVVAAVAAAGAGNGFLLRI
jgi:hypothetical protein